MELVDKYQDPRFADRTFDLAWTHSQVLLRQINATEADAQLYGRLAGSVIYEGVMEVLNFDQVQVSARGLRFAAVQETAR